ncbi:tetratricopeptide repeat protein [Nodularia sphaerocarpa]|uniref:tetratricopeptide repeat protein n=1 Tax=Nodularia sphaerocarpa TaxID=137816 RepID=UPI001EFAA2C6|nr:tetratricopeptide repeat protein [Nodularia sphaerocarpa]MDB9374281.1 tetratricopeptide repeat protein [Nodularia sphaerocarpa CS-585]MDB9379901.1 tetratricopeptide repeat protein [Nodularia sphaerocarpa CS-585A2]ULP73922.1 Photosystem I assembly protein Ycf3 [Nodularia sphaerocarpa UHCC 0038]
MTYFWRLFLCLVLAFLLNCSTTSAYSLPIVNTQVTANDFLSLGVTQMQSGNYREAIENFNQALELKSDFAVAYSDRCQAHLQLQDYHEAITDCHQAISLAPDNFETYLSRGLAEYRQGNDSAAIADYNQAIALQPIDFRAYYNRGLARVGEGNYSQAIADYNIALTQIPPTTSSFLADIYNDRGLAHLLLQDSPAAMLDFNRAIRLNNQDFRAYFNLGCAEGRNGDNVAAIGNFSQVIKLNPSNASAYLNRGIAQYHLGYHQGAIADLKKASEYFENQGNSIAREQTLNLLHKLGQQLQFVSEIA